MSFINLQDILLNVSDVSSDNAILADCLTNVVMIEAVCSSFSSSPAL